MVAHIARSYGHWCLTRKDGCFAASPLLRPSLLHSCHSCAHLSKQKPTTQRNSPHWRGLNPPRIHTAHFSHKTHMWLILLAREGHRMYVIKLLEWFPKYSREMEDEYPHIQKCQSGDILKKKMSSYIFIVKDRNFSLLIWFFLNSWLQQILGV